MSLARWDPFRELQNLENDMNRLFRRQLVSVRIDGDVGRTSGRDTGHVSARQLPGPSSPRDGLGLSALQRPKQDAAKHDPKH